MRPRLARSRGAPMHMRTSRTDSWPRGVVRSTSVGSSRGAIQTGECPKFRSEQLEAVESASRRHGIFAYPIPHMILWIVLRCFELSA